jgi:uncharacterized protein YndB with AHSA1/START domain
MTKLTTITATKPQLRAASAAIALLLALANPARATVVDVAPNGFTLKVTAHVSATPDKVYSALIKPGKWWSSEHTFSGAAANLTLDAKAGGCWCEKLPHGGSAMHMTVVLADPGKMLRLRGALGPFQGLGVEGAMTLALKSLSDGTELSLTYALGGYSKEGFDSWAQGADGVLADQVSRLKLLLETGSPEKR